MTHKFHMIRKISVVLYKIKRYYNTYQHRQFEWKIIRKSQLYTRGKYLPLQYTFQVECL